MRFMEEFAIMWDSLFNKKDDFAETMCYDMPVMTPEKKIEKEKYIIDCIRKGDYGYLKNDILLLIACKYKYNNIAIALIESDYPYVNTFIKYYNPYYPNSMTPLMMACHNGLLDVVLAFINSHKVDIGKGAVTDNKTALMYACCAGHADVALELIKTGSSNINAVTKNDKNTALIYACVKKLVNVAKAIINTGEVNLYHKNAKGHDALYYAKQSNLTELYDLLGEKTVFIKDGILPGYECPICLNEVTSNAMHTTKCNKFFHEKCLRLWRDIECCPCPNCKIEMVFT